MLSQYKKEPHENSTELVLPKEKIVIYKETCKLYAYSVNGNIDTLKLLFKNLKSTDDKVLKKVLIKSILQWVLFADYLSKSSANGK